MRRAANASMLLLVMLMGCGESAPPAPPRAVALVQDSLLPAILVRGEEPEIATLADRMAQLNVPAVSVALIDGDTIAWAHAWGLADVASGRHATPGTLFQAASISKPVAATAALTLVEDGIIDLDAAVNTYLTRWQVPASARADVEAVTLRHLVTHTAGLTVHGFPGYARGESIPDVVGVLDGRGNTDPVRVDTTPGTRWRYSGGGYTVMQLLLSDALDQPFADLVRDRVLDPIGMVSSTYEQPLPEDRWLDAATAYRPDGDRVAEGWHVYPEQAAAGLWTTPTDLARWGLAVLAAYDGEEGNVVSPPTAREMLRPGLGDWGLGPAIGDGRRWFGHGGANEGFRCQLVVFFDGRGAAVMTNGDLGHAIIRQILGTLALAYGWPDFRPDERTVVSIDSTKRAELTGVYRVQDFNLDVTITMDGGKLYAAYPGYRSELLSESEQWFFAREDGERFRLIRESGKIVALEFEGVRAVRVE